MTILPELTVYTDVSQEFRRAARLAIFNIALIAGFRPKFVAEPKADITYAAERPVNSFWLPADPAIHRALMMRQTIKPQFCQQSVAGREWKVLFPVSADSAVQFDLPAATLFFLGLHEQWTNRNRDVFQRFPATASIANQNDLLDQPLVSGWGRLLRQMMMSSGLTLYTGPRFSGKSHIVCLTHDIDYLSKFTPGLLFRELIRNFLLNHRHVSFNERLQRLCEYLTFGMKNRDPYRVSIERMLEAEQKTGLTASWLFKAGGNDKRDVTYNIRGKKAVSVMRSIFSHGHDIGFHPSFNAYINNDMFGTEIDRLTEAAGIRPKTVRQHYLRFEYPETWRIQVAHGCKVDSTLGFPEREGFRCGSCHPFLPFDFEQNQAIPLWEVPLIVMDGTLSDYRKFNTTESLKKIRELHTTVKGEEGVFVLLFHNTTFDQHDFPGWGELFLQFCSDLLRDSDVLGVDLQSAAALWARAAGFNEPTDAAQVINSEPV